MDDELTHQLIQRDWDDFVAVCRRLNVGTPQLDQTRITIPCRATGSDDNYVAVLECDRYDAEAPLLDFACPEDPTEVGRAWWPRMPQAPMNSVELGNRHLPILCVKGTRGYHLHPSHSSERYERIVWKLPISAGILHRLLHQWGPCQGRGV